MARRRESEFKRDMIVGARQTGHTIFEVVRVFNIPRPTVSCVYWEYIIEVITTHSGHRSGRPQVHNDCNWRHLARIVHANRRATLAENHSYIRCLEAPRTYPAGQCSVL